MPRHKSHGILCTLSTIATGLLALRNLPFHNLDVTSGISPGKLVVHHRSGSMHIRIVGSTHRTFSCPRVLVGLHKLELSALHKIRSLISPHPGTNLGSISPLSVNNGSHRRIQLTIHLLHSAIHPESLLLIQPIQFLRLSHSMESNILLARIETLRRRNNVTLIIIGNKVVQLSIILGILVFILLAIIKAKLICVITIPPQLSSRNFVFNDTIFAFQSVCSVHFGIFLRRSNPVTITQLAFLHRSRNSTINLNLNILLAVLNGINSHIDSLHRFQSMRSVLRITLRVREIIIRLRSITQSHILQVHIRATGFPIVTSRLVAFISRVSRSSPRTYTLVCAFGIIIALASGSLIKHFPGSSIITLSKSIHILLVKFIIRNQRKFLQVLFALGFLFLCSLSSSFHGVTLRLHLLFALLYYGINVTKVLLQGFIYRLGVLKKFLERGNLVFICLQQMAFDIGSGTCSLSSRTILNSIGIHRHICLIYTKLLRYSLYFILHR